MKVIAVVGLLFGGLTLLVTKALVVAKLAFLVAAALGIQKLLSGGGLNNLSGKVSSSATAASVDLDISNMHLTCVDTVVTLFHS